MNMRNRSICFPAVILLVGCRTETVEPAAGPSVASKATALAPAAPEFGAPVAYSTSPTASVWMQPMDLSTSVGVTPLAVKFSGKGAIGSGTLADAAARLTLRTWPELESVAITTRATDTTPTAPAQVEAVPSAPLSDRWYVLTLAALPAGASFEAGYPVKRLSDTSYGVRFRPGEEAVVTQIRVCPKVDGQVSVAVDLSERLIARDSDSPLLNLPPAVASLCGATTRPLPPSGAKTIMFTCTAMDLGRAVQVELRGSALRTVAGSAVPALVHSFVPGTVEKWADGCRVFRP